MVNELAIPNHYRTEFATNWEHGVQQMESKLKDLVTVDTSFRGKEKLYNELDPVEMTAITTRIGKTNLTEGVTRKYALRTQAYEHATPFDEWDDALLGDIVLPTSETQEAHQAAWGRRLDTILVTAATGTRYVGDTGTTAEALPASQIIASTYVRDGSSAASGLTYDKILRALEILGEADVDVPACGGLVCWVRMRQVTDLYASVTEFRSRDFSNHIEPFSKDTLLTTGRLMWMGILFVLSQRVTVDGSDIATVPLYCRKGIKMASLGGMSHIDIRSDLSHALQIRTVRNAGAVRTKNELVVSIGCDQSP